MSNEPGMGGGTILLGLAKEEATLFPHFLAVGVENPDKVSADLASQCASVFNMAVRPDISREMIGRKCVIRVDVAELQPSQKPLYLKSYGLPRGAFRRIGSTDQRCTDDDLQIFFQSKGLDAPDKYIVDGATWDDIDVDAIAAYRRARADLNPLAEELNWPDEDLLKALNCVVMKDDGIAITRAGLISFGKTAALRRLDPSTRVDYIRVPGKTWVSEPDAFLESIELRGPTLRVAGRVISTILDDVPKAVRFVEGSPQRTDIPLIPERVIREAVVNALAHRNYQSHEPVQILRYANRIEIRNPGFSLKSEERFDEPGSTLRNPHIAEILHETRFAETKGSGIRVMRQKMRESGLAEPTFISSRDDDKFTAIFLLHHFLSEEDWVWLGQFKDFELEDEQLRALIYIREMGAIDNACYRTLNQVDTLAASGSLRKLKEASLIESRGSGSRTYYVAGPQLLALDRRAPAASPVSMHANAASMHAKALPVHIASRITRQGKRIQPDVIEALIVEICAWQPSSAEEIAGWLGRTRNYVTNKFLFRMVREGRLQYAIPEMVKHPGQKYRTPPSAIGTEEET
jgi:ATP-dependent DNA helicase RecG